jgi:hypothetical protein
MNRGRLETRLVKAAEGTADQLINAQLRDACSSSVCWPPANIQELTVFFMPVPNVDHD